MEWRNTAVHHYHHLLSAFRRYFSTCILIFIRIKNTKCIKISLVYNEDLNLNKYLNGILSNDKQQNIL